MGLTDGMVHGVGQGPGGAGEVLVGEGAVVAAAGDEGAVPEPRPDPLEGLRLADLQAELHALDQNLDTRCSSPETQS